jgi:hypothetical protein
MAVVLAFGDRAMLDQDAQRPTLKAAVGRRGESWRRCFALGGAFHEVPRINSTAHLYGSSAMTRPAYAGRP